MPHAYPPSEPYVSFSKHPLLKSGPSNTTATDPVGRAAGLPPLTGLNFLDFAAMLLVLLALGAAIVTGAVLAVHELWLLTGKLWNSPDGLWVFTPVVLAVTWILLRWEKIK